jgi:DNA-binding NarL/FixJ family response regulator
VTSAISLARKITIHRYPDVSDSNSDAASDHDHQLMDRLTPRQREVLQLVVEGNRTKQIARKLEISIKTIEMHRAGIMDALNIRDVPGLVRFAIRVGLISVS